MCDRPLEVAKRLLQTHKEQLMETRIEEYGSQADYFDDVAHWASIYGVYAGVAPDEAGAVRLANAFLVTEGYPAIHLES